MNDHSSPEAVGRAQPAEIDTQRTETERRLERQTILSQMAEVIHASLDHQDVLNRLVEQITRAIHVTSAYICTYDHETLTSTVIAEFIDAAATPAERASDLFLSYTFSEDSDFLNSPEIDQYHWDDPQVSLEERLHLQQYGCQSVMIVPILIRGQLSAFFELWESRRRRTFAPEEQSLCQAIAQQAAIAIENATLYEEAQRRLREQTLINEAAEIILDSLDLNDVASRLAERLCQAIDATSAYFCLYNIHSRTLSVFAEYVSENASPAEKVSDLGVEYRDDDLSAYNTLVGHTLIVEHYDDPVLRMANREHMAQYGVKSVIFIPLNRLGRDSLGVLEVWESRRKREFSLSELRLCKAIARHATIAIEKAGLYAQAQEEIQARARAQAQLERSEQDYRGLFENAHDPVLVFDPEQGHVLQVNQRACEVYGYSREEWAGMALDGLGADIQGDQQHIRQILETGRYYNYQTTHQRRDGSQMHMEINLSRVHYQGRYAIQSINRDITERLRAEEQLRYEAFHDRLTGLPNRSLFLDRLEMAIARSTRRHAQLFAVLFLDLDRFKNINDSKGHSQGDALLVEVARRLAQCIRNTDTVARLGGDEFVILMEDIYDILAATVLCERIKEQLGQPFELSGDQVFTSASIGIVLSNAAYHTPEEYLRDADIAMYRAKNGGRGRYEVFDTTMREQIMRRLALEGDLRRAIQNQEFRLHYMPIVTLKDGGLTGFEALLRWQHPERGLLPPIEFIPVAEETGMIIPIGRWVLFEACQQMQYWRQRYNLDRRLRISINLSGEQLNQPDLVEQVGEALKNANLPAECLSLEVTESAIIKDVDTAIATLSKLRELGVSLQLDDFGTGYSSLSYLRQFPIDTIKIDRSFIHNNPVEPPSPDLVRTIILMGHEMGMDIVAEGIETNEQAQHLNHLGCPLGQGFLYSRPMDAEHAESYLVDRNNKPA